MIAAAAAAMIGGAFATTVYDITASLKATKGAQQKAKTTTYTVRLGVDNGTVWYKADAMAGADVYTNAVAPTVKISELVKGSEDLAAFKALNVVASKNMTALQNMNGAILAQAAYEDGAKWSGKTLTYGAKSAGKWCLEYKFTETTDAICYRKATTAKVSETIEVDDCCDAFTGIIVFGAGTFADCKQVQLSGSIPTALAIVSKNDIRGVYDCEYTGWGTWGNVTSKGDDGIETIKGVVSASGYAIGTIDAGNCEVCCDDPEDAIAFDCNGDEETEGEDFTYGTVTIKYNKSKTAKLEI